MSTALRRFLSTFTAATLVLGLVAFAPKTSAANTITFVTTPAKEYATTSGDYKVTVKMSDWTQDTKVDFLVARKGENLNLVESHTFTQNGTKEFVWDGSDAKDGEYGLKIMVNGNNALDHEFMVYGGPTLSFNPTPAKEYTKGVINYNVSVKLEDYAGSATKVDLYVTKKGSNLILPYASNTFQGNGTYQFAWDGKNAEAGDYTVTVKGLDANDRVTNTLSYELTVKDMVIQLPASKLEFVATPATKYTLGSTADYKFTVKITNFTSQTLATLSVENPDNGIYIPKDNYTFVNNNEVGEFQLNLTDYKPGTYKAEVTGKDKNDVVTNSLPFTFEVLAANSNLCAGFTDVSANDADCKAIEYVKSIGAMTGHDNGTFGQSEILKRDQIAKISLVAFKLFNANQDYCDGTNPFPDVTMSDWAYQYICRGVQLGMITGYKDGPKKGKYDSAGSVNRAEALALILRNVDDTMPSNNTPSYGDVALGQWFTGYAAYAKDHNLFPGENLMPTQGTQRVEVARILHKLHEQGLLD